MRTNLLFQYGCDTWVLCSLMKQDCVVLTLPKNPIRCKIFYGWSLSQIIICFVQTSGVYSWLIQKITFLRDNMNSYSRKLDLLSCIHLIVYWSVLTVDVYVSSLETKLIRHHSTACIKIFSVWIEFVRVFTFATNPARANKKGCCRCCRGLERAESHSAV